MGKLHLIGGEKGGVGKSFTSRLLAQYYIDNALPFVGFDTDQSHQTFSRFYGDYTSPITMDDYESLDKIVTFAEENPDRDIIVDLAAQTNDRLVVWLDDSELFELMEVLDFETYVWHVMDDGADSVFLLKKQLERYKNVNVNFVVALNGGRGEDFTPFEESSVYADAKRYNAKFVEIAKMQSTIAKKIDFNSASFWAASNNRDNLTIAERQRVRVWLKKQYIEFDEALNLNTADNDLVVFNHI